MMKNEIIPSSWRDSLKELRQEISHTVDRWIDHLRPEERREAEAQLRTGELSGLLASPSVWNQPRIEMEEDEDHLYISVEVPGLKKDELQVELDGGMLSVYGEKESHRDGKRCRVHYSERSYGAFSRIIALPCDVDRDKVVAKCRNGILRLTLPKTAEAKRRRIEINHES